MKKALIAVGGILWFGLVFLITWWLTFPSESVANRAKVEVARATGGDYQLSLSDVRPWWTGASANNVVLYEVKKGRGAQPGEMEPVFAFEAARVRASLFSLLRNKPRVIGAVQIGGSDLDFDVTMGMNKRGTELAPRLVKVSADDFPVQDLAGIAGAQVTASGGLDLEIDLEAEDGMRDAIGDLRVNGRDIVITELDPELTGGMDLGMEVPIDSIDVHFEVEDGKATVRTGKIDSSLVDTEIEGDITLREDMGRSTLDVAFAVELGEDLQMIKSLLKKAEWDDGKLHYKCTGSFNRPSCREDIQRGSRVSGGRAARRGAGRDGTTPRSRSTTLSPEEREKRRQEALERLRKNRERRAAADDDRDDRGEGDELDGDELEEIGYEEGDEGEEYLDDELPPVEGDLPPEGEPLDDGEYIEP